MGFRAAGLGVKSLGALGVKGLEVQGFGVEGVSKEDRVGRRSPHLKGQVGLLLKFQGSFEGGK